MLIFAVEGANSTTTAWSEWSGWELQQRCMVDAQDLHARLGLLAPFTVSDPLLQEPSVQTFPWPHLSNRSHWRHFSARAL